MATKTLLSLAVLSALLGCGNHSGPGSKGVFGSLNPDSSGNPPGAGTTPASLVWTATDVGSTGYIRQINVATGEWTRDFVIPDYLSGEIALSQGWIWAATTKNRILKIDPLTGEIRSKIPVPNLGHLYGAYGQLWVTSDQPQPAVGKIDPTTGTIAFTTVLGGLSDQVDRAIVTEDYLYVLLSNRFTLYQISASTGEVVNQVLLAGGKYGWGELGVSSTEAFVIDGYNKKLIRLDRLSLAIKKTSWIDPVLAAGVSQIVSAGSAGVFAGSLNQKSLVRIDTPVPTWKPVSLGARPGHLAFINGRLVIATDDFGELQLRDPVSSSLLHSTKGIYADGIAIP